MLQQFDIKFTQFRGCGYSSEGNAAVKSGMYQTIRNNYRIMEN